LPSRATIADALCAARVKYGVERRRGGLLPWFILYDVCAIIVIVIAYTAQIGWLLSHGAPSWIIWTKLYYAKLIWALASFPFVIFVVPVIGETLHQSKATGYDQAGKLTPQLTGAKMKRKIKREKEEQEKAMVAAERAGSDDNPEDQQAAVRIQSMFRGTQTRRGRTMRHVISLRTPVGLFVPASTIENWFAPSRGAGVDMVSAD